MTDPRDVLTRDAPGPVHVVRYGSHPDHVADVWLPDAVTAATPFVIFVHGGFWRARFDRIHVRPLCNDLLARGYAVAAVEYRRVGQAGGGWPGSFDDLALAFDSVPALVEELANAAGGGLAPPVLAGHSAGGHLVLWGAVRHRLPNHALWRLPVPPSISGVLALAPVADLADAHREGLGDGAAGDLLGGGPEEFPARYAATDPYALPLPEVPVVLVHGELDDRVPVSHSRRYAERAAPGAGSREAAVRLVELPGVEHFAVIDPLSPAWRAVVDALAGLPRRA